MATIVPRTLGLIVCVISLPFIVMGGQLASAGGSIYYLLAGILMLLSGAMLFRLHVMGVKLYALLVAGTIAWALFESGLQFWPLMPRLGLVGLLGVLVLLVSKTPTRGSRHRWPRLGLGGGLLLMAGTMLVAYLLLVESLSISPEEFDGRARHSAHNASTHTNWPAYGNSRKGTRYSPLAQINRENVGQLELAWVFRTGVGHTFKNTPIQVNDALYVCAGANVIIALDAETGEERWRHDANPNAILDPRIIYFTTTCRGLSFFEAPPSYAGECPTRILVGTTNARLVAVDAVSGEVCRSFGDHGSVNLWHKMGEHQSAYYFVTSSPAIVRGKAVVGGWVLDNRSVDEPSGVIRAFDAITGEFAWAWDMGRPGIHSEPDNGATYTPGTPNVWSLFSVDEENGLVFAPTGNPTPDFFGAHRPEFSEKHGSSVVAINGETGALVWSFQTVHHDLWDYDVPSQPVLVDIPDEQGVLRPAMVQATKRGEVFVLNRLTGEAIVAVEERSVPQGGVPEDWTSPTQPYSALPNVLDERITEAHMWGISPFDQMWCRSEFRRMLYLGQFTPPSTQYSLVFPGNGGGYNWGSVAVDEERHIMVGNALVMGNRTRLIPRDAPGADGVNMGGPQLGTPYEAEVRFFTSPLAIPCIQPPFGLMLAIDLQTQELLWKRPIGRADTLIGLPLEFGVTTSGGGIVTKGEIVFFGGTMDNRFRALDLLTGEELWRHDLPSSAQSTPMTYLSPRTRQQFVVLTVPLLTQLGDGKTLGSDANGNDPRGGYVFAFRLPLN